MIDQTEEKGKLDVKWYAIRVHTGFEPHVSKALMQTIDTLDLKEKIVEILVPTEKRAKLKGGKRVEYEEKMYPGFVLINMHIDKETWAIVNNIEHVTGFAGSRTQAEPISEEEIKDIKSRTGKDFVKTSVDFSVGETVCVVDGPFKGQEGKISEMDKNSGQVYVEIGMFGQNASMMRLKLDLFQIQRI